MSAVKGWSDRDKLKYKKKKRGKKKSASLCLNSTGTLPSEAEDEKGHAEDGGHSVPEQGGGPAGTEVETEAEGSSQAQQLTCHKIHLQRQKKKRLAGLKMKSNIWIQNKCHLTQIHQWESDYGVKLLLTFWGYMTHRLTLIRWQFWMN